MRRLPRILLNAATVLSAVLCLAFAGLLCSGRDDRPVIDLRIARGYWLTVTGREAAVFPIVRSGGLNIIEMSEPRLRVWFPGALALFAPLPVIRGLAWWVRSGWRDADTLCPVCGYDLRATPTRCPECGHVPPDATS